MVQGWTVPSGGQTTTIEIPASLLQHLLPATDLDVDLVDSGRRWTDDAGQSWNTYVLSGSAVTDAQALSQLDVPDHESCVEVGRAVKGPTT